jgi:hypothetical protein
MSRRDYSFTTDHNILKIPENIYPKDKLEKMIPVGTVTSTSSVMSKASFIIGLEKEADAVEFSKNEIYGIPLTDGTFLTIARHLVNKQGMWQVKLVGERPSYYASAIKPNSKSH